MKQKTLIVASREQTGRGPARRLRKNKQIPAVIYGKSGSFPITVNETELRGLMRSISGVAAIIQLQGFKKETVLSVIQEIKRNPRTDQFEHIDFHEVAADEHMHTTIPVHVKGEAYGVKNENAVLDWVMHSISVKCLPKDLPEFVEIDVTNLRIHQSIHIKELPVLPGVSYVPQEDQVVIACVEQKVEEEAPAEATPATPAAKTPAANAKAPAAKAPAKK